MKRKSLIIIGTLIIICLVIVFIIFAIKKSTISEIELNSKQVINQLEKVKIKGTDDSVIITQKVKWDVPDYGEHVTVSFSIAVPYTITVDGKDYNGIYELNDAEWSKKDNNPKYNFEVTNLTQNGDLEVLITNK